LAEELICLNAEGRVSRAPLPPSISLPTLSRVSDNVVNILTGIPIPAMAVGAGILLIILTVTSRVVIRSFAEVVVLFKVFNIVWIWDK
jgi:hypothetical protein